MSAFTIRVAVLIRGTAEAPDAKPAPDVATFCYARRRAVAESIDSQALAANTALPNRIRSEYQIHRVAGKTTRLN
jgi:hypothetical protein